MSDSVVVGQLDGNEIKFESKTQLREPRSNGTLAFLSKYSNKWD